LSLPLTSGRFGHILRGGARRSRVSMKDREGKKKKIDPSQSILQNRNILQSESAREGLRKKGGETIKNKKGDDPAIHNFPTHGKRKEKGLDETEGGGGKKSLSRLILMIVQLQREGKHFKGGSEGGGDEIHGAKLMTNCGGEA